MGRAETDSPWWAVLLFLVAPVVAFLLAADRVVEITLLLWATEFAVLLFVSVEFRDNSGVTQELASVQYRPSGSSALPTAVEEARKTLDAQVENLDDIDSKAVRILRVNVLLIGLILSALTLSARTDAVPFRGFLNVYLGTGIFLLIASTATAGLTYTASDFRVGMSKANITQMLQADLNADELDLVLSKSYAKWIRNNESAEILNAFYSTSTILLLIYAVAYLALGVYSGLVGPVPLLLEGGTNVTLLVLTLVSGYPSQVRRVLDEVQVQFP